MTIHLPMTASPWGCPAHWTALATEHVCAKAGLHSGPHRCSCGALLVAS